MKYLQVKLDDDLHDRFKIKTYITKSNMSDLIRDWIKNYLEKSHEEQ